MVAKRRAGRRGAAADGILRDSQKILAELLGNVPPAALAKLDPASREAICLGMVLIAARRRTHPGAQVVSVHAKPLPITMAIIGKKGDAIRELTAAERGKPVEHEIDFHDGEGPIVVRLPLIHRNRKQRPGQRHAGGRPRHPLTAEILAADIREKPGLSEVQRARRLTRKLKVPTSRSLVRDRLLELENSGHKPVTRGLKQP